MALCAALDIRAAHAMGHLHCLWHWALDYAQDGSLARYAHPVIAAAADWGGDADAFVDALVTAGFADPTEHGIVLHDWSDYAGKLLERRAQERDRQRLRRTETQGSQHVRNASGVRTQYIGATSDGTVPDPTKPDPTEPGSPDPPGDAYASPCGSSSPSAAAEPATTPIAAGASAAPDGVDPAAPADVQAVMDHWNRRWCPKPWPLPARLTPKRRTHIRNRLATYSAEQLCRAADNLRASPWHAGDNDRGWRADPEFLFRSDEQVERWLQAPDGPNRSPPIRAYGGRRGEEGETWS